MNSLCIVLYADSRKILNILLHFFVYLHISKTNSILIFCIKIMFVVIFLDTVALETRNNHEAHHQKHHLRDDKRLKRMQNRSSTSMKISSLLHVSFSL